jgi:hypothetical protein
MNQYKKYDIFSNSDVVLCINTLVELYDKTRNIIIEIANKISLEQIHLIIDQLQIIIDKISIVICGFQQILHEDFLLI